VVLRAVDVAVQLDPLPRPQFAVVVPKMLLLVLDTLLLANEVLRFGLRERAVLYSSADLMADALLLCVFRRS